MHGILEFYLLRSLFCPSRPNFTLSSHLIFISPMRTLALDIGNSRIKLGLFDDSQLVGVRTCQILDEARPIIDDFSPERIISCSVSDTPEEQAALLAGYEVLIFDHRTPLPVQNLYETPQTLGLDRLAAVVGAERIFGGRDCLVIDIGTCITYDFLDQNKQYHGGSISPGIDIRFRGMHDYTRRLPLISTYDEAVDMIGKSTREGMTSGVLHGIAAEIDGIILRYTQKSPDLQVILCGGDAKRFESKLKASIFASPELVLVGLIRILEYNEEKK